VVAAVLVAGSEKAAAHRLKLDGLRTLGEAHRDRKVVAGGLTPLAPTIYE
jgi:hypothetical protein